MSFDFKNYNISQTEDIDLIIFDEASYDLEFTPLLSKNIAGEISDYNIIEIVSSNCSEKELNLINISTVKTTPKIQISTGVTRSKTVSTVRVYPFLLVDGSIQKIESIKINLVKSLTNRVFTKRSLLSIENSILKTDTWFKFKIPSEGIYNLTYEELVDYGVITSPIPSSSIGIFSNSAEMLPFIIGEERMNDLLEFPTKLKIEGETFGPGNAISFYCGANGKTKYNESEGIWKNEVNLYSDTNFVFLRLNGSSRKNLSFSGELTPENEIWDYTRIIHHEKEWLSFIKSGKLWVGEPFENGELSFKYSYNKPKELPISLRLRYSVCARSVTADNNIFSVSINSDTVSQAIINPVSGPFYSDYVKFGTKTADLFFVTNEDSYDLKFEYHIPENQLAWLDQFSINSNERIVALDSQFVFKILEENNLNNEINVLCEAAALELWDITDIGNSFEIPITKNDSGFTFTSFLDTVRNYILIQNDAYLKPIFSGSINNQNLHAASPSNYVIITTKDFENQAKEIVSLHEKEDQLSGNVYFVDEIYNEFSSGRPEVSAIRDFLKTLYDKGKDTEDSLRFVLLFGDGSYDPKNRISTNNNLIPTFQSDESNNQTNSYVSDDFFGLMDSLEGEYKNEDLLDLGIGRLPINNVNQANSCVEKIKNYYDIYPETSGLNEYKQKLLTSKGSWKNNIVFVADDGDGNIHMQQGRALSKRVDTIIPNLNQKKVFLDSYEQINTSIGVRSPGANSKMNQLLAEGALIVNFNGHGGELGWMDERVYMIEDIKEMENKNKLPLFVTATCEFSRFDSPGHFSAGELLSTKEDAGAIALFTTVRLVFAGPNFRLNEAFYQVLQASIKNNELALGDLFKKTKLVTNNKNDRNFTLLGDPALRLSIPYYNTLMDSLTLYSEASDTINSLSSPVIHGSIVNPDNSIAENYDGWVEIILFDKSRDLTTLGSDDSPSTMEYKAQEDLLFKGKATVKKGKFSAQIYVPKDARKDFDCARLSFYAVDSALGDAAGNDETFILGGIDENAAIDNRGPEIEVFLDDTTFMFGDNVTPTPIFIAHLTDSSGINIIPNDIGRDIDLIIDERSDMNFKLNNYYVPSEQTFKKGEVIFPIDELTEGRHSLEFKVFDNQNNASKAYTEFIVENNPELALKHVLNYPNPFTTNTGFYFEHNQTSDELDVLIEIFTISGKIVKTLNGTFNTTNQRVGPITWNGLDEYGDRIGRGVYVYKVSVRSSNGDTEEAISKLVLLK